MDLNELDVRPFVFLDYQKIPISSMDIIFYRYASLLYKNSTIRDYDGSDEAATAPLLEKGTVTDLLHFYKQYGIFSSSSLHFHVQLKLPVLVAMKKIITSYVVHDMNGSYVICSGWRTLSKNVMGRPISLRKRPYAESTVQSNLNPFPSISTTSEWGWDCIPSFWI